MFKIPEIVSPFFVFLSAFAMDAIRSAWQSVYPILGDGDILMPVPTDIAFQLSGRLPLTLLTILVLLLLSTPLFTNGLKKIRSSLLVSIWIVWFAYFLFITWALALPFIPYEPVI